MVSSEKEKLYNEIMGAAVMNCLAASDKTHKLIFMDLNEKTFEGKIMMQAASIAKVYRPNLELYVCMGFFEYLIFRIKNKGINFKRIGVPTQFDMPLFIDKTCEYMAEAFNVPMSIYEEIYNEFYILPEELPNE